MAVVSNIFNQTELEYLTQLPEVLDAQKKLDTSKIVYFSVELQDSIKQKLVDAFGFDLSNISKIPFRWIRGDTMPHVDRGSSLFENTYLVYLTDAEGHFKIGDESYSMVAGSGFVFPEGLEHKVVNTNGSSRLLLGPMNELGNPVGYGGISANGATDTVYLSQDGSNFYYKINDGDLFQFYFPVGIMNINPTGPQLKVLFTTDFTISSAEGNPGVNGYFDMASDSIQIGDFSVKPNGTKTTITIDGVENYGGFIHNVGSSNITICNLDVVAINGSNLVGGYGWIGSYFYGSDGINNYIIGCSSNGPITTSGGGIVGSESATMSTTDATDLTIIGCTSTGVIGNNGGGIAGSYAGQSGGTMTIIKCSSTGSIGNSAGGIVGIYSGQGGATCTVQNCYSTGTIATNSGGIFGEGSGDAGSAIASNCYSRGNIGAGGGGIFGKLAGSSEGSATATNCYSTGDIGSPGQQAGGIYGEYANGIAAHCYTSGPTSVASGYIFMDNDTVPVGCYSEAQNDTSGWTSSNAQTVLIMTSFISTGTNTPYELRNMGPSPYSLTTIGDEDMSLSYSQSVAAGSSSIGGVLSGFSTYSILEIEGYPPSSTPTITINSTTGVISTTAGTSSGTYAIIVRAVNNAYSITTFELTVSGGGAVAAVQRKVLVQDASAYIASKRISVNNQGAVGINPVKFRAPLFYSFYKPYYKTNVIQN